jgi:hypothetical protein
MGLTERWRTEARRLKREVYALYLACRDPRVPWYAKAVAAGVVAYVFSLSFAKTPSGGPAVDRSLREPRYTPRRGSSNGLSGSRTARWGSPQERG